LLCNRLPGNGGYLVFAGSDNGYAVLAHQSAHTAVPHIQAHLFQFFGHPWPAIAAQTKTGLFFPSHAFSMHCRAMDVRQCDQIRSLPATSGTASESTQTACADADNIAKSVGRKVGPVFFDKPKSHCFRPAKNWVAFF